MKSLLILSPLFLLVLPTTSLFILLPLNLYPGTSSSAWINITDTLAAYPKLKWQVIVNPNSGPGKSGGSPADPNYITAIAKLNSYNNVQTLGYVDTLYTQRAYSAVTTDINTYASWSNYAGANISIQGIFFDDVNNTAADPVYTYMHNASAYAYATVPSDVTPVVFNPGALGPTQLFDYCDTMVEFENTFANYKNKSTILTIPSDYRDQSAIIINSTPVNTANIPSLVHTMAYYGIEAVYFSADCCYNAFDKTLLMALAAAVQAG